MFKKGDKVLLVKEAFETKFKDIYEGWDGKPLTVDYVRETGIFPVHTLENVKGHTCWKKEELMLEKVENEL